MKKFVSLFTYLILAVVLGAPITFISGMPQLKFALAAPSCAALSGSFTIPTDFSRPPTITPYPNGRINDPRTDFGGIDSRVNVPDGATYHCFSASGESGGGVLYTFFDADDNILSSTYIAPRGALYHYGGDNSLTSQVDAPIPEPGCGSLEFGCYWKKIVATIAWIPAGPSAWLLTTIGQFFNYLVDHTIIDFKGTIEEMGDSINNAWTAFRDIANIVIIGMFVFIAISLILGLKEYGEKKMIARVLIIAVLINFSLLFTKMIIDASHFTAYQFYTAAGNIGENVTEESRSSVTDTVNTTTPGIAGQFLLSMNITRVGDIHNILFNMQENGNGMWNTILFGIFIGVMFFLAALVLLYGSFLLVARGLLLIFLMITAPLAFASWLIPKFAQDGWHKWWDSLLRTAIFAPLLMIFLWASLTVATQINTSDAGLGSLIDNPAGGIGIGALFNYVFVLGLLFMSIKLASKFSGTIAGFTGAAMAVAAPFTLGNRLAAPLLSRMTGRPAAAYARSRGRQAAEARDEAAVARSAAREFKGAGFTALAKREERNARKLERTSAVKSVRAARGGTVAGSKMNIMNTGFAKAAVGAVGVTGFMAGASGKDTKSYQARIEERAKVAEKVASKIIPSEDDKYKARTREEKRVEEQRRESKELRETTLKAARDQHKTTEEAIKAAATASNDAEAKKAPIDLEIAAERERLLQTNAEYAQAQRTIERDTTERKRISNDFEGVEYASELSKHIASVSEARKAVEGHESGDAGVRDVLTRREANNSELERASKDHDRLEKDLAEHAKSIKVAEVDLTKWQNETKTLAREAGNNIVTALGESAAGIAQKVGERQSNMFTRAVGAVTGSNKAVGDATKDKFKSRVNTGNLRKVFDSMKEDEPKPTTTPPPAHP